MQQHRLSRTDNLLLTKLIAKESCYGERLRENFSIDFQSRSYTKRKDSCYKQNGMQLKIKTFITTERIDPACSTMSLRNHTLWGDISYHNCASFCFFFRKTAMQMIPPKSSFVICRPSIPSWFTVFCKQSSGLTLNVLPSSPWLMDDSAKRGG